MENVLSDFHVPKHYIIPTSCPSRWEILTSRFWIREILSSCCVPNFIIHDTLTSGEVYSRLKQKDKFDDPWSRLLISVINKKNSSQIIALPQDHSTAQPDHSKLSYSQTLHYVSVTNYKNLWKQAYKKYNNQSSTPCSLSTVDYNSGVRDLLIRLYGCPLVVLGSPHLSCDSSDLYDCHTNTHPALAIVESKTCFYVFQEHYVLHTLQDAIDYSPALLNTNYTRSLFVLYQLINVMRDLHDRGLLLGEITLGDIYVTDNLWIQVQPKIVDSIYELHHNSPSNDTSVQNNSSLSTSPRKSSTPSRDLKSDLDTLVKLWVEGSLSNFDYIYSLNQLAGRKYGDPRCHFVFPWVTDFSGADGSNWRDLTKSKFRLNKGDRQLDLTYESLLPTGILNQAPHHVSDVLSEITYYVYLARQTPRQVLCTYVRPKWVPGEYPLSIQRLQEWTPDECIPEFFTDPNVFKSIHPDLPDLELPSWAHDADLFISIHRGMLESQYVSERLHHWIDLTFGYKLSGVAAVKSKNVCLQLVDNHTHLTSSGIVPLFSTPHPQRLTFSPYFAKNPPRLTAICRSSESSWVIVDRSPYDEDESLPADLDEEEVSTPPVSRPLALSRFLSRSKNSLLVPSTSHHQQTMSTSPSSDSLLSPPPSSSSHITLPKDYSPALLLNNIENLYHFINKTCYRNINEAGNETVSGESLDVKSTSNALAEIHLNSKTPSHNAGRMDTYAKSAPEIENNFKERPKQTSVNAVPKESVTDEKVNTTEELSGAMENAVRQIAKHRLKEMLLLGCLIVELYLNAKCKPFQSREVEFNRRFRNAYVVLKNNWSGLPRCLTKVMRILFHYSDDAPPSELCLETFKYPLVNEYGLAPPSPHQLLIPSLTCVWFPASFERMYATLRAVASYEGLVADIGAIKVNDPKLFDSARSVLTSTRDQLNELRVRSLAGCLESLLESQTGDQWTSVVCPYVVAMLGDRAVQLQAAWYLLDPVCRALGPQKSCDLFLPLVTKLYDSSPEGGIEPPDKRAKLYHRSFLLRLMLRFGLAQFLDHFVVALVEAVGGIHDVMFTSPEHKMVTSLLSTEDSSGGGMFSPLDEDSSAASEHNGDSQPQDRHDRHSAEPEMFEMEEGPAEDQAGDKDHVDILMEQLEDQRWLTDEALDLEESPGGQGTPQGTPQAGPGGDMAPPPPARHKLRRASESVDVRKSGGDGCRISDVSEESLIWLSHRLGPVLTARYITRNLLRMLSLCYMGGETLRLREGGRLQADVNAAPVLDTLTSIVGLYGEQFIVLQYIPHVAELIATCKRTRVSPTLEGGLVASMALLKHTLPYLSEATLTEIMQDVLCKVILHPCIRLLASTQVLFPSGHVSRSCLATKLVDTLYMLSLRIPNRQLLLVVPALQRFFQVFDKVAKLKLSTATPTEDTYLDDEKPTKLKSSIEVLLHQDDLKDSESAESVSPPPGWISRDREKNMERVTEELTQVFSPALAHMAYIPFLRYFNESFLDQALVNHEYIKTLSHEAAALASRHDGLGSSATPSPSDIHGWADSLSQDTGSFGTVRGNRLEIQDPDLLSAEVTRKMEYTARHLRGNWRAYWEHEIGKPASGDGGRFNIAHVKLQTFTGHLNSVKCLHVMDNENSFMSASRDKTVKLWTLRNQGDGSASTAPQWTYTYHRKSVLALSFIERLRLVASCDSVIHFWDPWVGRPIQVLEKIGPVNTLKALPPPHSSVLAATTDPALRLIDARSPTPSSFEFKICINPIGLIRCIAVPPSGSWIAIGQASGVLTLLDLRTGTILASWKGHEGEILQLAAADDSTLVSSSLDQTVSAWHPQDGALKCNIQAPTEPVHCLTVYKDQIISSTTANRLGVHSLTDLSYSCTKLRSDSFKGIVTTLALAPLNKQVLVGSDSGLITLFC